MTCTPNVDSHRCDFCDEFSGGLQNTYVHRYGEHAHRRDLLNDGVFRVFPTLGQLAAGHLLIAPSRHITSMAGLKADESNQLKSICNLVRRALEREYGPAVFFEHGIQGTSAGGCGIDHAHMHAVPVACEGVLDALTLEFGGCAIEGLTAVKEIVDPDSSYLFFEDSSGNRYVFPVMDLPSQYMRKLVAKSNGKSDWDWRKCGQEPELIATLGRLAPLFLLPR